MNWILVVRWGMRRDGLFNGMAWGDEGMWLTSFASDTHLLVEEGGEACAAEQEANTLAG